MSAPIALKWRRAGGSVLGGSLRYESDPALYRIVWDFHDRSWDLYVLGSDDRWIFLESFALVKGTKDAAANHYDWLKSMGLTKVAVGTRS